MNKRIAKITRKTKETNLEVELSIDGKGRFKGKFGIPFFEHMLDLFTTHGLFDLNIKGSGDLDVDGHHTLEDLGICMGQAFSKALGDKAGIVRFGSVFCPMEESCAHAIVDICERPFFLMKAQFPKSKVGEYDSELSEEFLRAFTFNAKINLHIHLLYGQNLHHMHEAIFKAVGRVLDQATRRDDRIEGVLSSKGIL